MQNQSRPNIAGVVSQLHASASSIHADRLPSGTLLSNSISPGRGLARLFGDPTSSDPIAYSHAPNVFIQPNAGVIYSGSSKKIAKHGGGTLDDTDVALIVSLPSVKERSVSTAVSTTQISPTILRSLELNVRRVDAVRLEGTRVLPGLFSRSEK